MSVTWEGMAAILAAELCVCLLLRYFRSVVLSPISKSRRAEQGAVTCVAKISDVGFQVRECWGPGGKGRRHWQTHGMQLWPPFEKATTSIKVEVVGGRYPA
jgi:hypothetical protein